MSPVLDRFGIGLWTFQSTAMRPASPTALYRRFADQAVLVEELGFHSVWTAEHRLWYDGFCPQLLHAQAFAAARTTRLRFGQAMLVATQHDPEWLARNAETLQRLSGGRLELGLGLGHRDAEFDALGLRRDRRGRLLDAVLDALEHVGARLWLGGMATKTLERAARRGAGLMLPQTLYPAELPALLDEYRSLGGSGTIGVLRDVCIVDDDTQAARAQERLATHYLEEAGAWWVLKGSVGFANPEQLDRQRSRILAAAIVGTPERVVERLSEDTAAGVEFHCLRLNYDFTSDTDVREQLQRIAEQVAPLLSQVPA
jgi:alkanesulfonate monooxygenase SsuD/methylene tetrahydromethanopterin reductase-like flavin-dependent oxidoreductase (luciferase family)